MRKACVVSSSCAKWSVTLLRLDWSCEMKPTWLLIGAGQNELARLWHGALQDLRTVGTKIHSLIHLILLVYAQTRWVTFTGMRQRKRSSTAYDKRRVRKKKVRSEEEATAGYYDRWKVPYA